MQKLLAVVAVVAVLFVVGSAGALEAAQITIGQALIQMIAGVVAFAVSAGVLLRKEKNNAACANRRR